MALFIPRREAEVRLLFSMIVNTAGDDAVMIP
jgi:hypothetical protein